MNHETKQPLHGRVAVVTGATAGIGRAVAVELAQRGAAVVVNGRRNNKLDELVAALQASGANAAAAPGDAAEQETVDAMLQRARELAKETGATQVGATIVVANAGRGLKGGVLDSDSDAWEEVVRTNQLGVARLLRAAGGSMRAMVDEDATAEKTLQCPRDIVVLGSVVGRHVSPFSAVYGATKFAVHAMAEALRRELAASGVRVSLVEPGFVESEFQSVAGYDKDWFGGVMENAGPALRPEDIAELIGFAVTRPAGVHLADALIRPTRQEYP